MTAKEYLLQISKQEKLIEIKKKEIEKLRLLTDIHAVRYDLEKVSGGNFADRTDIICDILDYEQEVKIQTRKLINLKKEILEVLKQLNNQNYISLLYMRYFEHKKWEEISIDLKCSYRWVIKLHGKALTELEEILKK